MLKKMNSAYPKTSPDFDEEFVFHMVKCFFSREEIIESHNTKKLNPLKKDRLKFLKGKIIFDTEKMI